MEALKFTGTKTFRLIPIGKVSFSFKRKTNLSHDFSKDIINVDEINILCETDVNITAEQETILLKTMKKAKTDLLSDGHSFFTTRGKKITEIRHSRFREILNHDEDVINKFRYSNEIPVKEI